MSKVPLAGSSGCNDATTDEATIRAWWTRHPQANVAIACGKRAGVYVVDVDAVASEIMPRLPETWIARTPRGGWHYVYAYPEDVERLPNTAKKSPNAIHGDVDTRGDGGYILAFPSVTSDGRYEWINDVDPVALPSWIVERVKPKPVALVPRSTYRLTATSWAEKALDEEVAKLASTEPGGRNHAIARAAFKLGQIAGAGHLSFGVAHDELAAVVQGWPSVKKSMGTLKRCMEAGARSPRSPTERVWQDPLHGMELVVGGEDEGDEGIEVVPEVLPAEPVRRSGPSADEMDAARWDLLGRVRELGGLCDSFCGWVVRGADHPQPALTIGALLVLGSALAGRRLVYRRSTSSLYVVNLGGSGEGKGRPQSCLGRVIDECWSTLKGANSFSSGPAFVDGVKKAVGGGVACCVVLDEYGMQLASVLGPRAAVHRQDVKHSLTEIATKGTDKWSPALSLVKGGGKMDLVAPVVSLLGSTTPESLHSVLTSTEVADGFVGRHLWMRAQHTLPEWQPVSGRGDDDIPRAVRDAVVAIRQRHEAWHLGLPVVLEAADFSLRAYDGVNVLEDDEAAAVLDECKRATDRARREGTIGGTPAAVLARLPEFAARVSLVLAALSQPEAEAPRVTAEIASVAVLIATESASTLTASLQAHRRASWDDPAAQVELVVGALRACGGSAQWSDLLRQCRGLRARDLADVVERLEAEGTAKVTTEKTAGRPRRWVTLA